VNIHKFTFNLQENNKDAGVIIGLGISTYRKNSFDSLPASLTGKLLKEYLGI
jgi:hypothetical protein